MKSLLTGIALPIFFSIISFSFFSCSEEEVVPSPTEGLTRFAAGWVPGAASRIEIWATESVFAGYNPITIVLTDSITGKPINDASVALMPIMQMMEKSHSCPVETPIAKGVHGVYNGAIIFTMPSGDAGTWSLDVAVQRENAASSGEAVFPVAVSQKDPSPLIIFKTDTQEKFILAAHFPDRTRIGSNVVEVICFRSDGHSFFPAEDLNFTLSTEMPSMDHGSPNNVDPVHDTGGHYKGQVNFTMTGDWRIHLAISKSGTSIGEKYFDVVVN